MNLVMISGGVRSGKSAYAEKRARERSEAGSSSVLYVATGLRFDEEMDERIDRHRSRRPESWHTLECPHELSASAYDGFDIVLVDTLSAWIANRLMALPEDRCRDRETTERILAQVDAYLEELGSSPLREAIVVTDEVGWGGVAMSPLGRWFQDVVGEANQRLAERADEAIAVISGLPWRLKG
ncbi:bifunctional adenosylcobinamide kinase/adenosylcobinamide-phosphate guanylyltransferase [Cohnella hongkongensis]|uniref:Adenosylcobinamide kinase n=1 Tax=Cohnella hongkongensis TaxID=178337 RepID=A0ABV9F6J6_9BACL